MKKTLLVLVLAIVAAVSTAQINSNSFVSHTDFSITGNGAINLVTGDMDGDGKKDVVVANQSTGEISIFRNTSTSGSISFASRIDSTVGGSPGWVCLNDLDGDGKLDIVVSTGTANNITVYRNVSTSTSFLISAKQVFSAGNNAAISIGDLDADNKEDIVLANYGNSTYSILRNTSTLGSINFASVINVSPVSLINGPSQVILNDIDGDSKKDMVIFNQSVNNVHIFQNTTLTAGSITFSSTAVTLAANITPHRGDVSDIDGDGKPDIVCSNYSSSNTSVFRNTSTSGSISFDSKVDFSAPGYIQSSILKDLDNDGKPELIQSSGSGVSSKISVYRNFATSGTISSTSSFGSRLDISSANSPTGLDVDDIDGDGNLDILSANFSDASFSVFRSLIVPSNGLLLYYPFTGNAGDSSGFGNNGTVTGSSLTTDRNGTSNKAYSFNGSSNYISASNTTGLLLNTYTYSLWMNPSSLPSSGGLAALLDIGTTTADQFIGIANNSATSSVGIGYGSYYNSSSANGYWTGTLPNTGTWYHIALMRTTDSLKLYVNGILVNGRQTSSSTAAYGSSSYQCYVGRRIGSTPQYFNGSIDEVRVYDRVLTLSEIQQLADIIPPIPVTNYYSNASGYLDSLSTWGTNPDGSGTHPLNFDSSNTIYHVVNNTSPTQSADWIVTGVNTAIVFGDGSNSINMSVPSGMICGADSIYIRNGVTYTVDGTLFYNKLKLEDGSTVQYISSGTETLIPASYSNLVVYGGTKSISGNTTVRGTLAMLADIDCGTDTLTLGNSTSQTGTLSYTSGAIIGAFSRWFAANTNTGGSTGLFPMGSSAQYNPIQVEYTAAPTSGGVLTGVFTSPTSGNIRFSSIIDFSISPAVSLKKVSPDGFWTLTPSKGLTGGTYKAIATATGFSGISSISGLRLMRRDNSSSAWTLPASSSAIAVTGSTSAPVVGRSGLAGATASRDFGIGADSSVNALPVTLISFEGNQIANNNVLFNWVTSQEFNNDYFEIEKLINKQWTVLGTVKGNINSTQLNSYSFIDEEAFHKTNTEYYRLKQVDIDGNYEYSHIITVSSIKGKQTDALVIYPNPSNGIITIKGLKQDAIVRDALGNEVLKITADGIVDISQLKQGVYFIQSEASTQKLIKY